MTPQVNRDYPVEITLGLQFETEPIDGLASARQLRCPAYHGTLIGGGKCLDQVLADRRPLGWPVQPLSRVRLIGRGELPGVALPAFTQGLDRGGIPNHLAWPPWSLRA